MFYNLCVAFSISVLFVYAKNEEYKGFRVYSVKFDTEEQQNRLDELKSDLVDFLRKPSLKYDVAGRAMIPPSHFGWFEEKLEELGVKTDIVIENVYEHLNDIESKFLNTRANSGRVFDFDGYYRYEEILEHLRTLQETYAGSGISLTLEEFGVTDQNRPLVYLKITNNTLPIVTNKPVVIVEAAINPREWITVPSALNIVNRLVQNPAQFLDKSEWIVIPVVNPDGYEYSHTNLRLWTKNMSTRSALGFICPGVNINRNFDIAWLVADSSSSPCSHIYAGDEAFSEAESQMLASILEQYGSRTRLYISLQNNGGFVSYPWHYERAASGMFIQHLKLGRDMAAATNDNYNSDVGWEALGDRASGTSTDYAQESGIIYSLNVDAVQRGLDGVNIPESEIRDVIEDMWRAVVVAADALL